MYASGKKISYLGSEKGFWGRVAIWLFLERRKRALDGRGKGGGGGFAENSGKESPAGSVYVGVYTVHMHH